MTLLVGRKAICHYLQCSWRTVVRQKQKYCLPLRQHPSGKPCLDTDEYEAWVKIYDDSRQ